LRRFGPRHSLRQGLALLTNDRKASGLVLPMSVLHNMTIASLRSMLRRGWLNGGAEREAAGPLVERLRIRIRDLEQEVATLSGGNQQKVLLARWLLTNPRVFMLDEPTRGVDVGAKSEIYELMNQWTSEGRGILMITSELPELMAMSDRIVVMHRGRITGTFEAGAATEAAVMSAAMGETLAEKEAGL
jgi:ABC-type sugar transport system ATPase subunit